LERISVLRSTPEEEAIKLCIEEVNVNGGGGLPIAPDRNKSTRIHGYMHVSMMNDWQPIFTELVSQLVSSGLYAKCEKISIALFGASIVGKVYVEDTCKILNKLSIDFCHESTNQYEYPTLQLIKNNAMREADDVYCFYIHTKGASVNERRFTQVFKDEVKTYEHFVLCSDNWRKYMAYFIIDCHAKCIDMLVDYDAAGVDLNQNIYIGNFWWSKYSHIRKLPDLAEMQASFQPSNGQNTRFYAERWIGWKNIGKLGCMWISDTLKQYRNSPYEKNKLSITYYNVPIIATTYR
jgi:hypothetical protein